MNAHSAGTRQHTESSTSGTAAVSDPPVPAVQAVADRPPAIDAVLAGFIVWLARRDVAPVVRRRYHVHAERYLCWQAGGPDYADRTLGRYLADARRVGVGDGELGVIQAAVQLLGRYQLTASRAAWTRPSR
jgi:hypothetical protein